MGKENGTTTKQTNKQNGFSANGPWKAEMRRRRRKRRHINIFSEEKKNEEGKEEDTFEGKKKEEFIWRRKIYFSRKRKKTEKAKEENIFWSTHMYCVVPTPGRCAETEFPAGINLVQAMAPMNHW